MLYNLWQGKVRVGEVITDEPLVKGDIVQTVWLVVDAAWQVDAGDCTNTRSSGDILVELLNPEPISEDGTPPKREYVSTGVKTRSDMIKDEYFNALLALYGRFDSLGEAAKTIVQTMRSTLNYETRAKQRLELRSIDKKRFELLDQMDALEEAFRLS